MKQEDLDRCISEINTGCKSYIFFTERLDDNDIYMLSLVLNSPEMLLDFFKLLLIKDERVRGIMAKALVHYMLRDADIDFEME